MCFEPSNPVSTEDLMNTVFFLTIIAVDDAVVVRDG